MHAHTRTHTHTHTHTSTHPNFWFVDDVGSFQGDGAQGGTEFLALGGRAEAKEEATLAAAASLLKTSHNPSVAITNTSSIDAATEDDDAATEDDDDDVKDEDCDDKGDDTS